MKWLTVHLFSALHVKHISRKKVTCYRKPQGHHHYNHFIFTALAVWIFPESQSAVEVSHRLSSQEPTEQIGNGLNYLAHIIWSGSEVKLWKPKDEVWWQEIRDKNILDLGFTGDEKHPATGSHLGENIFLRLSVVQIKN